MLTWACYMPTASTQLANEAAIQNEQPFERFSQRKSAADRGIVRHHPSCFPRDVEECGKIVSISLAPTDILDNLRHEDTTRAAFSLLRACTSMASHRR